MNAGDISERKNSKAAGAEQSFLLAWCGTKRAGDCDRNGYCDIFINLQNIFATNLTALRPNSKIDT